MGRKQGRKQKEKCIKEITQRYPRDEKRRDRQVRRYLTLAGGKT